MTTSRHEIETSETKKGDVSGRPQKPLWDTTDGKVKDGCTATADEAENIEAVVKTL
jgi:hypothetical protein